MFLTNSAILNALATFDAQAKSDGMLIDLAIYGGAALSIAFDLRQATRNVDAVIRGNADYVRKLIAQVAVENEWPEDWLNDAVKGFLSAGETLLLMEQFKAQNGTGLRVFLPSAEYLFAMKCMAMRLDGGAQDVQDIRALGKILNISDYAHALEILGAFYPLAKIPAKVAFGLEEIFSAKIE